MKSKIFLVPLSLPTFSDGNTRNAIHVANNFKSFYCSYTTPKTPFLSATKLFYKIWMTKEKLIFFVQNVWFNLLSTFIEPCEIQQGIVTSSNELYPILNGFFSAILILECVAIYLKHWEIYAYFPSQFAT